jgi:hypothetical protein
MAGPVKERLVKELRERELPERETGGRGNSLMEMLEMGNWVMGSRRMGRTMSSRQRCMDAAWVRPL